MWALGVGALVMGASLSWVGWRLHIADPRDAKWRRWVSWCGFIGTACSFAGLIGLELLELVGLLPSQDVVQSYFRGFGFIGLVALPCSTFAYRTARLVLVANGVILFLVWSLSLMP